MSYLSFPYVALVLASVLLYYVFPKRFRWIVLLIGSGVFYYFASSTPGELIMFGSSIVLSFAAGIFIRYQRENWHYLWLRRLVLSISIVICTGPLVVSKFYDTFIDSSHSGDVNWIIPLGLSFYTLQLTAYLIDTFKGRVKPTKNIFKYALFISFFPQIIQGPIPRYNQLSKSLFAPNPYNSEKFMGGVQLILWGLFLKYLIADKAFVVVNTIFNNSDTYTGTYIFVGGILYTIQLYTDFLSCVSLSRGVAGLFGVDLVENFNHPYFADSLQNFWRRWHISLSSWLRDYIYIPMGGSRRGRLRKYLALLVTFAVSGIWHGSGVKFLVWGLLQAVIIILCDLIPKFDRSEKFIGGTRVIKILVTNFIVMLSWIIFRAPSLGEAFSLIKSMFATFNPWILLNHNLTNLGISDREYLVLFLAVMVVFAVSLAQERGVKIRQWFARQNLLIKWAVYLVAIWSIWIFGTYGYGFNAQDFIYGGF